MLSQRSVGQEYQVHTGLAPPPPGPGDPYTQCILLFQETASLVFFFCSGNKKTGGSPTARLPGNRNVGAAEERVEGHRAAD